MLQEGFADIGTEENIDIAFARGGAHLPIAHALRLLSPQDKPLLGEKYVHGRKKERRRMKKNNAKFSGHYVYPRTETVRAHALRSHQFIV